MLQEEAGPPRTASDRATFAAEVGLSRPGLLSRLIRRRPEVTGGGSACGVSLHCRFGFYGNYEVSTRPVKAGPD